jgi:hypothetical protein
LVLTLLLAGVLALLLRCRPTWSLQRAAVSVADVDAWWRWRDTTRAAPCPANSAA